MVDIARGYTFATNEVLSPTKLHNLVDNAVVSNVYSTNLTAGVLIRTTADAAATISSGADSSRQLRFRLNSVFEEPGSRSIWKNNGAATMPEGTCVSTDKSDPGTDSIIMSDGNGTDLALGLTDQIIAPGTTGRVLSRGIKMMTVYNLSASTTAGPGEFVIPYKNTLGDKGLGVTRFESEFSSLGAQRAFAQPLGYVPPLATQFTLWVRVFK